MKLYIRSVNNLDKNFLKEVSNTVVEIYSPILKEAELKPQLKADSEAYDSQRKQYHADKMLESTASESTYKKGKLLAITSKDLYSENLNFVFGQARCPGKEAIISLHRLNPEFYGQKKNKNVFHNRAAKEAVHELGHTFGLGHCMDPECVMSFSNSIVDVDRKKLEFCEDCRERLDI